ncbi:ripening-related protein grip22-like [Arachis ipaensis]|uniref:Ripening-related protein n=2 Tax=Arachis hypogaea TaxID=3818 RepID=A0A444XQX3_ARAHY|nr:ripening-related protein grip22-like [Arachis ipaensis]RYQ92139.1 hypothetical protein Ahy_B09g098291 isoform A [Arachis hypogaea]
MGKLGFMVLFGLLTITTLLLPHHVTLGSRHHNHHPKDHHHDHHHSKHKDHDHHHHGDPTSPRIEPHGTHAILTFNDFGPHGDGGGPSECDSRFHPLPQKVVALSTGWYNNGEFCGRMIRITARNGRSAVARVVDECDSTHGCKHNIVDASKTVWHDLGLNTDIGEVPVTWTLA